MKAASSRFFVYVYPSADGRGIFFYKYFYKSVAYPIKGITFAYT